MNSSVALDRLRRAGVWSKKQLGQHFLTDPEALQAIVDAAKVSVTDTVVEIGPGMGVLTKEIISKAARVIAFEYDQDMVGILREDLPELEIIEGDVLKTAPEAMANLGSYKVVANIPYQIT